jgi:hypothetical protein
MTIEKLNGQKVVVKEVDCIKILIYVRQFIARSLLL